MQAFQRQLLEIGWSGFWISKISTWINIKCRDTPLGVPSLNTKYAEIRLVAYYSLIRFQKAVAQCAPFLCTRGLNRCVEVYFLAVWANFNHVSPNFRELRLPALLISGHEAVEIVNIINNETTSYSFSFEEFSTYSAGHLSHLIVEPLRGVIPPKSMWVPILIFIYQILKIWATNPYGKLTSIPLNRLTKEQRLRNWDKYDTILVGR